MAHAEIFGVDKHLLGRTLNTRLKPKRMSLGFRVVN